MTSTLKIRSALGRAGYTVSGWARANGYLPGTVQQVIRRACNDPEGKRQGILTHQIIADLTRDLGMTIVPGIAPSPAPGRTAA